MKDLDLTIHYQFADMDELPQEEQELIMAAIQATHNSYANYSHFHVGAALRLADGSIMIGANQENAAFPSSLCAERSAIFAAQSQKPEQAILTLAIAARNDQGMLRQPVTPVADAGKSSWRWKTDTGDPSPSCSMARRASIASRA